MFISRFIKIIILLLINNIIFAVVLGGQLIIDPRDSNFVFNDRITITDTSGTFGSVSLNSTGNFTLANSVNDNRPHPYSLSITQDNKTSYICSISPNQQSGLVYLTNKQDIKIVCRGLYYITLLSSGLLTGETIIAQVNNQLSNPLTTNVPQYTLPQSYFSTYQYNLTSINFQYPSANGYRKCLLNNTSGIINNNENISINCNSSSSLLVNPNPPISPRLSSGWKDSNGNFYLFGGFNFLLVALNDLWKFNVITGQWTIFKNNTSIDLLPRGRYLYVAWTDSNDKAYMFGGLRSGGPLNDLWEFNTSTGNWVQIPSINNSTLWPSIRYGSVAWTDNNDNAYVFGGYNGTYLNDLWEFNCSTLIWTNLTNNLNSTWPESRDGAEAWYDSKGNGYIFGGLNNNNNFFRAFP